MDNRAAIVFDVCWLVIIIVASVILFIIHTNDHLTNAQLFTPVVLLITFLWFVSKDLLFHIAILKNGYGSHDNN